MNDLIAFLRGWAAVIFEIFNYHIWEKVMEDTAALGEMLGGLIQGFNYWLFSGRRRIIYLLHLHK